MIAIDVGGVGGVGERLHLSRERGDVRKALLLAPQIVLFGEGKRCAHPWKTLVPGPYEHDCLRSFEGERREQQFAHDGEKRRRRTRREGERENDHERKPFALQ